MKEISKLRSSIQCVDHLFTREIATITQEVETLDKRCRESVDSFSPADYSKLETSNKRDSASFSPELIFLFGNGKIFKNRDSILSDLLHVKEFQTVYNIFCAMLILLGVSIVMRNHFDSSSGKYIDWSVLSQSFGSPLVVAQIWALMFAWVSLGCVFMYTHAFLPLWLNLTLYFTHQCVLFLFGTLATLHFHLPTASGFITTCEQARFTMKLHSFFRAHVNGPPSSRYAEGMKVGREHAAASTVGRFFYFLFCPTRMRVSNVSYSFV